ncbi:MAG TPA: dienelactone hydrolase family protein [Opitutaceae bacterium]|jgi:dienelactone hydrolase|nr:dienelactone hydrolase family protein [Opitutaceae bacterium]
MKTFLVSLGLAATALSVQARIVTKSVPYEQAGVKLEGFLAYDDEKAAAGKLPGVLVVHEWWGLNDYAKHRAVMLAKLGYVAFAADMYGDGTSTTDAKKAGELSKQFYGKPLMAERARAGLDQLLATGLVDESRVAAIGYCFGGAVCQALAYSGAPLAGIVSFHGSLVPAPAGASNKVKLLICHGALDPFSKPEAIAAFRKSMDDGGFDYQFISYAGAVHAFTNPDADNLARQNGLNGIGYNAAADRRSWQHMQVFFTELFGSAKN